MLRRAVAAEARRRQRISIAPERFAHDHAQPQAQSAGPKRRGLEPWWLPLYRRISKVSDGKPPGIVAAEMDEWLQQRSRLSEQQILAYVRELTRFEKNEGALELLDWMEARGANLSPGHQAVRLKLVSKVHGIQAAEEYFWSLPDISKSVKTYSCLLNCYGNHGLAYKGLELYEKMKAKNIVPDKLVYNYLMKLYQKAGQPEKVLSTFEEMRESGISADKFVYFTLIESYITMNDLDAAEKVLEELQKVAPVHWSLYTLMANYYIKLELFGKAEVALKKVEQVMDKAELQSWTALLSLHARCGNSTEVKRIWESLKSTFKKCLNRSYLVMLQALRMIDDFESLQQIFQEWQSSHECYDVRIINIMIRAYLDKGMIDEAEAIRQSTMAQGRCDGGTILGDAKNMVTAHKWVPSEELVSKFLKHYEELKDVAGVESFLECLNSLECLDAETYDAVMQTYVLVGRT
ncbi:hypothetical protein VPH35_115595 [Triticum aestivum]